ncbi:hypothetical protein ACPEEZ_08355 [Frigoribacterium sp. 2-23]|uniref:hypothetical protein n=1 Tax=Frigoribacterium sp. 2-23 TaxID=3415006 RepID=UPI003C6F4940
MFTRRSRGPEPEFESDLDRPPALPGRMGVGAQVFVVDTDEDPTTPWPSGPTGVVLRAGGSAWQGVSSIGGSARTWWVEFDVEQTDRDGRGPFDRAQVAERFLRLAPPIS